MKYLMFNYLIKNVFSMMAPLSHTSNSHTTQTHSLLTPLKLERCCCGSVCSCSHCSHSITEEWLEQTDTVLVHSETTLTMDYTNRKKNRTERREDVQQRVLILNQSKKKKNIKSQEKYREGWSTDNSEDKVNFSIFFWWHQQKSKYFIWVWGEVRSRRNN